MRERRGWGPTGPPPWWPEGESWPPRAGPGSEAWHGFGRRFVRGALLFLLVVVVVPLVAGVVLAVMIGGWESVALAVLVLAGLGGMLAIGAGIAVRNLAPLREMIGAAGRLADGDHSARVRATSRSTEPIVSSFNQMAERLQSAELQRRRLLAELGHELRTPLTVIRGEIEAFADGVHQPTPERLEEVLADVAVMERLLDDLNTLSSSEAGQLALHVELTDLVDLAGSVVHNYGTSRPRVSLRSDRAHIDAEVDPVRIREVITNLISNAVRATGENGEVTVSLREVDDRVELAIADTGIGIESDQIDTIFERFHKGAESDGSGLGLTISRYLVEAHGGRIAVDSTPGVGTTVVVDLPLAGPA